MGKKSLPKAIRTTTVDAREASAGPGASEQRERLAVAAMSSERLDSRPAAAKPVHASDIVDEPSNADPADLQFTYRVNMLLLPGPTGALYDTRWPGSSWNAARCGRCGRSNCTR